MNSGWRRRVIHLFKLPALTFGMVSTGLGMANATPHNQNDENNASGLPVDPLVLPNTLNATAKDQYAAHRSHSSHGSHRSSSGGSYRPSPRPAPVPRVIVPPTPKKYEPAPTPRTTLPLPKQTAPSTVPKPNAQYLSMMVVRVQAALMRQGYFEGDIDGILGPQTRAAIFKYQKDKRLKQTGRMDIGTLTKLGISIP